MIRIMSDSVATSDYDELKKHDVDIIPLSVQYDGKIELDTEMDFDAFNEGLAARGDNLPKSSMPSIATFEEYFTNAAEAGDSVVGVFISRCLSSSIEGALMAAKSVKQKFQDFECRLIDSFAACGPQMATVLDACAARDAGGDLEDVANAAIMAVKNSRIMFTPDDLRFLVLGGRLSSISAKAASLLKIYPIITTIDGKAEAFVKVRTKQKADDKMFDIFKEDVENHGLKYVEVQYAGKKTDEFFRFATRVNEFLGREIPQISVSPVISTHVGPSVGISYECLEGIRNKFTIDYPEICFAV